MKREIRTIILTSPWLLSLTGLIAFSMAAAPGGPELGNSPQLPLSQVILYSSGVGYFERSGEVQGNTEVQLRFRTEDINDLLKSMVVRDFNGGRVSTVTYGSRDPLTKTLRSFGLDLTDNPTLGQLLNQARGQAIELLWPTKVTGTILGVEKKKQIVGDNKEIEAEYLNVLTEDGLQSIPLSQVQKVKLLDDRLNAELRQALAALATSHDTQKKTVGVSFTGEGNRKVSVTYISQTPVWKTSYRLVLDDTDRPFMQGWAIVENTSDEDWENVRLSLVSGRPISFVMDLYQPLYTTRPVVEPELYLSLRPQVYGEALGQEGVPPQAAAVSGLEEKDNMAFFAKEELRAGNALSDEKLLRERAGAGIAGGGAGARGVYLGRKLSLDDGVAAIAQTAQAGELFEYGIQAPVTLARQKSAMLPIIHQSMSGEKVSIYNQNVQTKHPLNGFRLKNTSTLHLMQGPITVFDASTYAGDARIEDLAPGQERLLSYGLDLKTEVEPQAGDGKNDLLSVKIRKGTLIATRKAFEEKTYNVRNRDQKKKFVLIEHPFRSDWQLVETKNKPERTRDVYRFPMSVDPDKTASLVVREEKQFDEQVQLVNSANDVLAYYLRAPRISDKVKQALGQVVTLRDRANQTGGERTRHEKRTQEITQEQGRIRENMQRLSQNSDLYGRYVKKLDQQETELEALRSQIETLKETEAKQQRELNDYLLNLSVD